MYYVQVLIKAVEMSTSCDETSQKQLSDDLLELERYAQNCRIASMISSLKQKLSGCILCSTNTLSIHLSIHSIHSMAHLQHLLPPSPLPSSSLRSVPADSPAPSISRAAALPSSCTALHSPSNTPSPSLVLARNSLLSLKQRSHPHPDSSATRPSSE